ncbi:phosphohydrolase [Acetobacter sacchari]|uniref:Phosphohydrolase n=1 Tax=Acetobacter sacchari TaxID=2661687 RepID=A0ABS3LUU9_9PROT|nr:phosphohydrolase [Acetobacter sacchari]MBO1359695.1 phosphohydrolase [Acetobacter sacchari]
MIPPEASATNHDFSAWTCIRLSPRLTIHANGKQPVLPSETEACVTGIWDDARRIRPTLFNGRIFCADAISTDRIDGHWTEYRRAFAQIRRPGLFGPRPLRQLAVCGVLFCPEGLVLARRQRDAAYLGGFWQSPPAGTVEARASAAGDSSTDINLAAQILAEAEEELGLGAENLTVGPPVIAVTHAHTEIVDICVSLTTALPFAEIESLWRRSGDREYEQITVVAEAERSDWLSRPDLIATTRLAVEMMTQ